MFQLEREEDERPDHLVWDETPERAREIVDWARDEALILFAAATPPTFGAPAGSDQSKWRLQLRVPVSPAMGGGDVWVPVPPGATVRNHGTWIDPVFRVEKAAEKKPATAAFSEPPQE